MVQRELPASSESTARTGVSTWLYRANRSGAVLEGVRGDGIVATRFDLVRLAGGKFAIDGRLYAADGTVTSYNIPAAEGDTPPATFAPDAAFTPIRDSLAADAGRAATAARSIVGSGGPLTLDPGLIFTPGLIGGGLTGGGDAPPTSIARARSCCSPTNASSAVRSRPASQWVWRPGSR